MSEFRIRQVEAADRPVVDRVESAAFGARGEVVVALVHELRRSGSARFELLAEADGGVVGHVLMSRGWLDASSRLVEVHVLSPLAVDASHRRHGVASALIEHAVAMSAEVVPAVFLEGDPAFYSRRGFVPAAPLGFRSPSPRIPEPGFQVRLLPRHEPWMTGPLVYPDAFWALDSVGRRST